MSSRPGRRQVMGAPDVTVPAGRADHLDAADLARAAGRLLLRLDRDLAGADLDERGAAADAAANQFLLSELAVRHPGDAVLTEEAQDSLSRLDARRVWIIDPLDGTREFGEQGRDDWAVHVALVVDGRAVVGAVALPARDIVRSTAHPTAVGRWEVIGRCTILVSRTRPPPFAEPLARMLDAELVPMGSAGAKTVAVLDGRAAAYVHAGGMFEWDAAAPVAVAETHGLLACRLDGRRVRFNRPDPYLPDLLVCMPRVADSLLGALARMGVEGADR